MSNKEELVNLLFPPWKLMRRFLVVTIMLILGTAFSGGIVFNLYLQVTPEWEMGVLFSIILVFCLVNFRVTRGSFLCAKILKYYALFLACICIPSLLMGKDSLFSFLTVFMMLGTFYLISSKRYQQLVQYQFDFFEDIKEARAAVEKEIAMSRKSKKRS